MRTQVMRSAARGRGKCLPHGVVTAALLAAVACLATPTRAQDIFGGEDPAQSRSGLRWNTDPPHDRDTGAPRVAPPQKHGEQRPFVYAIDPSIPVPGEVGLEYSLQGVSGSEALRPLPANLGAQGLIHGATIAVGATPWLSVYASGLVYQPGEGARADTSGTGQVGARLLLTRPDAAFRAGFASSVLREFGGSLGVSTRATATYDVGVLRIAGNAHVEKILAAERDSIDLLAFGGASIKTTEQLRLGAEYVGQDLEDAFEAREAEGGARHFAGPVASLRLADGAVWVTAGPAFGLNKQSPSLLGRLSMLASF